MLLMWKSNKVTVADKSAIHSSLCLKQKIFIGKLGGGNIVISSDIMC